MANMKTREKAANKALDDYLFGDGVVLLDSDVWTESDSNDWVKTVYLAFAGDDVNADSHPVEFHAEFKNDNDDKVDRTYALLITDGTEIGQQKVAGKQSFGRRK